MGFELFGKGEDGYRDPVDLDHRVSQLDAYFFDFNEATGGQISSEQLVGSQSLLDIGMGKGALGRFLRQQGTNGRIVGVDKEEYEDAAYDSYSRTVFDTMQNVITKGELDKEKFEHILCVSPSPELGQWVMDNSEHIPLMEGGKIFIATELPLVLGKGFSVFHGISGLKNLYLMQK